MLTCSPPATACSCEKIFTPPCNICCWKPCARCTGHPAPFNRLGEFPAEQPNDLPLSPTAEAFYRTGPTFWQRYTSFWLTSLLNRIVFFAIPVVAMLIPIIGFAPRFYRWLHVRRIERLHRALGNLE